MSTPGINPYEGLFGLIGTIMGNNARQRNEAAIANTIEGIRSPTPTEQTGLLPNPAQMPNINFAPQYGDQSQQPTAQNLGAQQLAQMQPQQQNVQQRMSGLLSPNGTAFATQQPTQQTNDQQAQFTQAVQANPEWYRQGVNPASKVYVGDRPDIAQNDTVTASGNAVDLSPTPVKNNQTTTNQLAAPVRTNIAKQYKDQSAAAIKELVKRGMPARDAFSLVQDTVNKRTEEDFNNKAEEYAQSLDSKLDQFMNMDFQTSGSKAKFIATLAQYNQGMKRIGREGADLGLMKELMSQGDVVMQKEDNGGAYRYVMVKKNGERFDDGSFQMAVPGNAGEWTEKQLSPGEKQQGELTRRGQDITMRGQDISAANSRSALAARGGSGVGGTSAQKMSMYKWASGYSLQPTGETDYSGKPVMTRVQNNPQLAAQLAQELGYGGEGGGGGGAVQNTGDNRIDGMIANMRNNGAPEQIINDMVWEEQNRGGQQQPRQVSPREVYQPINTDELLEYGRGGD
jgi:hypothetical protein